MKVKELIAKLQEFDGEIEVWVGTNKENANFLLSLGEEYREQFTRLQKLCVKEVTDKKTIFVIA